MLCRDDGILNLDPPRMRDPLGSEGLELFNSVVGREEEELADEVQALIVGEVGCRKPLARAAVEVLSVASLVSWRVPFPDRAREAAGSAPSLT